MYAHPPVRPPICLLPARSADLSVRTVLESAKRYLLPLVACFLLSADEVRALCFGLVDGSAPVAGSEAAWMSRALGFGLVGGSALPACSEAEKTVDTVRALGIAPVGGSAPVACGEGA